MKRSFLLFLLTFSIRAATTARERYFLSKFLDLIEKRAVVPLKGIIPALRERLKSRRIVVRREQPTYDGRLIDIVVSEGDIGLAIENKLWAKDQDQQLKDYATYLSRRYSRGWMLLYISGEGAPPASHSLPSDMRQNLLNAGEYLELSYAADLVEWLDGCVHMCDADKVRWFLRDLQNFAMTKFKVAQSSRVRGDE